MAVKQIPGVSLLVSILVLSGCAHQGAGTAMSGSAGGETSVNANKSLMHCATPLGTLAVDDGRYLGTASVTTIEPLIRLAVQQSNCFVITSIGNRNSRGTINGILEEQRESGEYRAGSSQQKGQRVAADYLLEPTVIINNETTGGVGASLVGAGLSAAGFGGFAPVVGALAGNTVSKMTEVALTLTDIRSTVQVAISQGSASTSNYSASLAGLGGTLGGFGAGKLTGFSNTPEGQATAAAFMDAYNNLVQSLNNYKAQDVKGGMGRGGQLKVN